MYHTFKKIVGEIMEETSHFDIKGMHCAACATRIEKTVSKIDGVTEISVNLTTEKGRVTFHNNRTSISDIFNKINKIGFEAKKAFKTNTLSNSGKRREISVLRWKFIFSALFTIPLAWSMFAHFNWASLDRKSTRLNSSHVAI